MREEEEIAASKGSSSSEKLFFPIYLIGLAVELMGTSRRRPRGCLSFTLPRHFFLLLPLQTAPREEQWPDHREACDRGGTEPIPVKVGTATLSTPSRHDESEMVTQTPKMEVTASSLLCLCSVEWKGTTDAKSFSPTQGAG